MTQIPPRNGVVVVGAGIAGIATALKLAPLPVTVLSAARLGEGASTAWAQGGIAAAMGGDDSPAAHAADTLAVASGIADPHIIDLVTRDAPGCIADLIALGVPFDRDDGGNLHLGREGGHSRRRVLHAQGDATGAEILRRLVAAARTSPSIALWQDVTATELARDESGRVVGLTIHRGTEPTFVPAVAVVLATGGLGGLYRYTTNPVMARGRGLALAVRAGATLADLEFVQFHPTALDVAQDPMPLVTEALRGEGAVLVDDRGRRLMEGQHLLADLAPRDFVARAVWRHRRAGRRVYLDAREALGAAFATRFPTVFEACRRHGIDPTQDLIPVVPAAHYHMGGIAVDARGRSSVEGLWAVGEVAASGLHGANRLASNSLLEALVFAARAAVDIKGAPLGAPVVGGAGKARPEVKAQEVDRQTLDRLRALMDEAVGLERDEAGLQRALGGIEQMQGAARSFTTEVQDALLIARLVATAALWRHESRGAHYHAGWPEADPAFARRMGLTLDARETPVAVPPLPAVPSLALPQSAIAT